MADIYCRHCREPWDIDSLHDAAQEQEIEFDAVYTKFRASGCNALGWGNCHEVPLVATGMPGAETIADQIYDMNGSDVDGAACDFEDAVYLGLELT